MKRGAKVGIAAGVIAVLALGGAVALWMLRPPSLEDTARAYLTALSAGDIETISGMTSQPLDAAVVDAFTSAEAHVAGTEIVEIQPDGRIRATGTLAGEPAVVRFTLDDTGGRWELSHDFLATIEPTTTLGDSVWIGDALVATDAPFSALPAVYVVSPAPRGLLTGAAEVAVDNAAPRAVAIEPSLAPEATERAQEQLDDYAAQCAVTADVVPDHCGLRVPWAADLASLDAIAYRIEQTPVVTLSPDDGAFAATGGVVVATATGTTHDGAAGSFTYRADDWALRGSLAFAGDEMVLSVD